MTRDLEWARAELRRQDDAVREWLGDCLLGRPTFNEAEHLQRAGIPACHRWDAPDGPLPQHLDEIQVLRKWQDGACALCAATRGRLVVDHCHSEGWVRGLLCSGCNTAEALAGAAVYAAYRERPPAVMLGIRVQYGGAWDGFSRRNTGQRNAHHVDAAAELFANVIPKRFTQPTEETQ